MTGYTVHTGSSKNFASGWDRVFSARPKAKAAAKSGEKKTSKKPKKSKSS